MNTSTLNRLIKIEKQGKNNADAISILVSKYNDMKEMLTFLKDQIIKIKETNF